MVGALVAGGVAGAQGWKAGWGGSRSLARTRTCPKTSLQSGRECGTQLFQPRGRGETPRTPLQWRCSNVVPRPWPSGVPVVTMHPKLRARAGKWLFCFPRSHPAGVMLTVMGEAGEKQPECQGPRLRIGNMKGFHYLALPEAL